MSKKRASTKKAKAVRVFVWGVNIRLEESKYPGLEEEITEENEARFQKYAKRRWGIIQAKKVSKSKEPDSGSSGC